MMKHVLEELITSVRVGLQKIREQKLEVKSFVNTLMLIVQYALKQAFNSMKEVEDNLSEQLNNIDKKNMKSLSQFP
jgi:ABC-type dipeptide/oligopeptide/nickel transport system ATPase subunit